MAKFPILCAFVDQVLTARLDFSPRALVIPLGKAVNHALNRLITAGRVDPARVLVGFPQPSGGNGHRVSQFVGRKASLFAQINQWARISAID
jgi:hypothetical protein